MPYGTILKSARVYKKIFNSVKGKIRNAVRQQILIEHVGGTSLRKPAGKGDIDVYVMYKDISELRKLRRTMTSLFGKPAKVTNSRIRYNLFMEGIEVELQLVDRRSFEGGITLREYLNTHPAEAKRYSDAIAQLRTKFLAKMSKIKRSFTRKALSSPFGHQPDRRL